VSASTFQRFSFGFRAMACDNRVELFASDAPTAQRVADAVIAEVQRIEAKYSRYRSDSVVCAINTAAPAQWTPIDTETAQLLAFADACFTQSDGLFDITAGVLRRAWDFRVERLPTQESISELLPLIGWQHVERRDDAVRLMRAGMELDFGGFGKEYAADRAAAVLQAASVTHAFVDLGGDIVVTGPQADGGPWSLGVRHPRREGALLETLAITSGAVATSGDYERYIDVDGVRYCHILNPRAGWPVSGAESLQCVTAFAPTCMVAGALTTISMLKGRAGLAWLAESGAKALAVAADGALHRYP
jgi:thiamine biosynthesis lipoprotein